MFNFFKKKKPKKPSDNQNSPLTFAKPDQLKLGMTVRHLKFGKGQIVDIDDRRVATVNFIDGNKRIMLAYAKLVIVD